MNKRLIVGWFIMLAFTFAVQAQQWTCAVCGKPIISEARLIVDQITGETNRVCLECAQLDRCFACGMPVKDNPTHLTDGRILCSRDASDAVMSEDEAKDICRSTKDDIDRLFSRYMTFPGDNVEVSIMDKFHLENLFSAPGYHSDSVKLCGATASNPLPGGKLHHSIDLLSFLSRSRLRAVCAHEYTHTWMNENLKPARKGSLDRNTVEGFCELIAYKYMESRQETLEMQNIKRNTYTQGQVEVLLAADDKYDFNTVVEWMQNGEDSRLDLDNLDRVRAVQDAPYSALKSPAAVWTVVPPAPPTAVPATLVLKGISGTPQERFALINNATFETMEKGRVRVGQTNVLIRCLEIRDDSVIIQVDGSTEKKQLFLSAKD
ncbi:MAG TPA: LIM domain-containing protein [Verrucomicrobiae bacterium]|nr:LIM domain-containing protein [Verrucomicrobiae bacterium]